MSRETADVTVRLKRKTSYPDVSLSGGFAALGEYVVTVSLRGFKTEQAAIRRRDEIAANVERLSRVASLGHPAGDEGTQT